MKDLIRRGGDGRYLGLSSLGPQSSFSGDSSYSFEVGGINLEELDVEYEVILENLIAASEESPDPDDRLVREFETFVTHTEVGINNCPCINCFSRLLCPICPI